MAHCLFGRVLLLLPGPFAAFWWGAKKKEAKNVLVVEQKLQFFSTLTLLEVGDVLGGEGDADAVHLGDLALSLGTGSLVSTSRSHLWCAFWWWVERRHAKGVDE